VSEEVEREKHLKAKTRRWPGDQLFLSALMLRTMAAIVVVVVMMVVMVVMVITVITVVIVVEPSW
jgi:type IV secretory pathway component VirB8